LQYSFKKGEKEQLIYLTSLHLVVRHKITEIYLNNQTNIVKLKKNPNLSLAKQADQSVASSETRYKMSVRVGRQPTLNHQNFD